MVFLLPIELGCDLVKKGDGVNVKDGQDEGGGGDDGKAEGDDDGGGDWGDGGGGDDW